MVMRIQRVSRCGAAFILTSLLLAGCTAVKPLACGLVSPTRTLAARMGRHAEPRYDDMPTALLFASAPILIPLNYVYLTAHSTIEGLFSGFASDLNVITGNASVDSTFSSVLEPSKTNALPHADTDAPAPQ